MRLRYIKTADFRKSEATLFAEVAAEQNKFVLGERDVVLLVSRKGNQLMFVFGFQDVERSETTQARRAARVLSSTRLRLMNGCWDPLLLRHYAEGQGLQLEGLASYERHYRAAREKTD